MSKRAKARHSKGAWPVSRQALALMCVLVVGSCAGRSDGSDDALEVACTPRDGELVEGSTLEGGEGTYRVTLVATPAEGDVRRSTGTLELRPNPPDLRRLAGMDESVSVPLYGWSDIDLAMVGAREIGDVASQAPERPGVLVLEQRADGRAPSITMRLGSIANERDRRVFDSGYTALSVKWVEQGGRFGGSWTSGVRRTEAEGYFCIEPYTP